MPARMIPYGPLNDPARPDIFPESSPITDFWGKTVQPFYTYGYLLHNHQSGDAALQGLLMRCLADIPADRPTLEELLLWLQQAEDSLDNTRLQAVHAWSNQWFQGPAPVRAPPPPLAKLYIKESC